MLSDGYYWVKFRHEWLIAEYREETWYFCGQAMGYASYDLQQIGNKIEYEQSK